MSELPVPVVSPPEPPPPQTLVCANCHATLNGEYCAACGQRHEPHIHTVTHFAGEAFESISHADSRLWRTLWCLFARPGFLTREFFAGRRVAYLPPFRLYLVLSVIFFLVTGLPSGDPGYVNAVAKGEAAAPGAAAVPDHEKTAAALREAADALEAAGPSGSKMGAVIGDDALQIQSGKFNEFCQPFDAPEKGGSGAAARRNIREFCNKVRNDSAELGAAVVHNLPRAMFLFLPLLAVIMKLLYWRPKRYYVEHLLFLVHNHAFVFLTGSSVGLLALLLEPWIGEHVGWLYTLGFLYMVWYIYRGMRNYYAQNWALTFSKYLILGFSYIITSFVVLLLTLVFSAVIG